MFKLKKMAYRLHRSSALCSACAKLDLSPGAHTPGIAHLEPKERRKVGSTPSCPLCRLVRLVEPYTPEGEFRWSSKRGFYRGISNFSPYDFDRIVFVDEEHCERPPQLCGRIIASQADMELLKTWLRSCEHVHGAQCAPNPDVVYTPHSSPGGLKTFRVIDVENMCIVDAEPGCRYLALSYTWGQVPSPSLLKANKTELMTPHGLEPLHEKLPKTLRDAFHLVKLMGEKFIWTDRLCLVQDDQDDMQRGIQKMDLVYEGSVLCVVAAAGVDGDGGLPGVHAGERKVTQQVEEIRPGLRLVKVPNLHRELGGAYYMKRGWT
ncbi:HET domain-containing protein [Candidatus Bathyarchaeota archaeon]|nr:HET domain-containing protein [Candidatus Bathyarchaeota archaeon]